MSKEFFGTERGCITGEFRYGWEGDTSVIGGVRDGYYLEDVEGDLATIYFAGKKVCGVWPSNNNYNERVYDGDGYYDCDYETEEIEYRLGFLNAMLKAVTDEHLSKEEAMTQIESCLDENGDADSWEEYFRESVFFDVNCGHVGFKLREELLPDIKALFKEGKFVLNNELVAEAGKGYIK